MNSYIEGVRDAFSRVGVGRRSGPNFASFIVGAGVGLVAGAAVAMLVTPSSGPEMRRELQSRAKRLAERTQGALSDVKQSVRGRIGARSEEYAGRNEVPMG